jgi:hypothetical protein
MNIPLTVARSRSKRRARSREGIVLLVVMLVVLMATTTASFAIHNTGFELRSAGSLRRSTRARHTADGLAAYGQVLADEGKFSPDKGGGGADSYDTSGPNADFEARMGMCPISQDPNALPGTDTAEVYDVQPAALMTPTTFASVCRDNELLPAIGTFTATASPYVPSVRLIVETWPAPTDQDDKRKRYIVTAFSELGAAEGNGSMSGDYRPPNVAANLATRTANQSVSIARAIYEK